MNYISFDSLTNLSVYGPSAELPVLATVASQKQIPAARIFTRIFSDAKLAQINAGEGPLYFRINGTDVVTRCNLAYWKSKTPVSIRTRVLFDALPSDVQAAFYLGKVAVDTAISDGKVPEAKAILSAIVIPDALLAEHPNLNDLKAEILAEFPA